jgi:four helix bundle suffix protein
LVPWPRDDARRAELITRRPDSAEAVAVWVRDVRSGQSGRHGQNAVSTSSTKSTFAEISANGALALIAVACSLLDRQITSLESAFLKEGGFTERLYRTRRARMK